MLAFTYPVPRHQSNQFISNLILFRNYFDWSTKEFVFQMEYDNTQDNINKLEYDKHAILK